MRQSRDPAATLFRIFRVNDPAPEVHWILAGRRKPPESPSCNAPRQGRRIRSFQGPRRIVWAEKFYIYEMTPLARLLRFRISICKRGCAAYWQEVQSLNREKRDRSMKKKDRSIAFGHRTSRRSEGRRPGCGGNQWEGSEIGVGGCESITTDLSLGLFSAFIEPGVGHVLSEAMWEKTRAFFARGGQGTGAPSITVRTFRPAIFGMGPLQADSSCRNRPVGTCSTTPNAAGLAKSLPAKPDGRLPSSRCTLPLPRDIGAVNPPSPRQPNASYLSLARPLSDRRQSKSAHRAQSLESPPMSLRAPFRRLGPSFSRIHFKDPFHKPVAPDCQPVGEITYPAANQLPEGQFPVALEHLSGRGLLPRPLFSTLKRLNLRSAY